MADRLGGLILPEGTQRRDPEPLSPEVQSFLPAYSGNK